MINHARTLLLNSIADDSAVMAEYISADFQPLLLTGYLADIHKALLSLTVTAADKNCRVRQLLMLLHSSILSDDIRKFDKRITYLPFSTNITNIPDNHSTFISATKIIDQTASKHAVDLFSGNKSTLLTLWSSCLLLDRISAATMAFIYQLEALKDEMEK